MAELLIVVAIITILSGVGFIAVQRHQKSLTQLERNTIAKEIFVAAQNHLTMAERQGYLGVDSTALGTSDGNGVYYFQYNTDTYGGNKLLDQMLPLGAIDEFIRVGTNSRYVIRYTLNPSATVLDVWYWSADTRQRGGELAYSDVSDQREVNGFREPNGVIVGWYGGNPLKSLETEELTSPSIEVINADRLTVELKTNYGSVGSTANVKLIVTGVSSGASVAIPVLRNGSTPPGGSSRVAEKTGEGGTYYVITLDDVTVQGCHFADLNSTDLYDPANEAAIARSGAFYPGENIVIKAVAYDNTRLTNIAYSNEWTTNSLFADVVEEPAEGEDTEEARIAKISNIRHLENLDETISGFASTNNLVKIDKAVQVADLVWKDTAPLTGGGESTAFLTRIGSAQAGSAQAQVYKLGATAGSGEGRFQPVSPTSYSLVYEGFDPEADTVPHSITGIVVNATDAGLFGSPTAALTVRNLELIDFDITGTGDAGALAGKLVDESSVTNVLAHNSDAFEDKKKRAATITSSGGSAGGLIGSMDGTTVSKCAAALVVKGGSNAGGLLGKVDDTNKSVIQESYAGGHTVDKKDGDNVIGVWYGDPTNAGTAYNVTASGSAGGLIGSLAGGSEVENCYSTCSVRSTGSGDSALAGGFVGHGSSGSFENCYATGLVSGAAAGAFAGKLTASVEDCLYYEIINEITDANGIISYLPPVPGSETKEGISALDESVTTYNAFTGADSAWTDAGAYNPTLASYYTDGDGLKYNLKSIPRLAGDAYTASGEGMPADFVATHYGDWPAPEIFVLNEK